MRRVGALSLTLAAVTSLAACDGGGGAPGAVSEGEAKALEEAAEMLEERQLPEGALPPTELPVAEEAPGAEAGAEESE